MEVSWTPARAATSAIVKSLVPLLDEQFERGFQNRVANTSAATTDPFALLIYRLRHARRCSANFHILAFLPGLSHEPSPTPNINANSLAIAET